MGKILNVFLIELTWIVRAELHEFTNVTNSIVAIVLKERLKKC